MRLVAGLMVWWVIGSAGAAEWKQFKIIEEGVGDGKATYYIKADDQEQTDVGFRVWYVVSYAKKQQGDAGANYQSAKVREEFDCREKRRQQIYWIAYKAAMAGGGIAGSEPPRAWEPVPAGSTAEKRMNFVCGGGK
ncbi:MAG: hypothetical protein RLZZ09_795 [Pseudomonadota bacterium]